MNTFQEFLSANYLWFLVISIILLFALIGYFVDQNEQKKGISKINKVKEREVNIEDLQALAQNKSLNNAVSDAMRNDLVRPNQSMAMPQMNMPMPNNNIIMENSMPKQTQNVVASSPTEIQNPVGFDVLTK